ncbi:unnamed protein product [Musa textilis]
MLYIMMIILQFSFIGKYILSKVSLGSGMSQCVLVVFSHAFGTLSMASLAFFLERSVQAKMTKLVFTPVMNQIFYYAGQKHTSATFSSTMSNISPAMTFVGGVLTEWYIVIYQAKVVGTLVTVVGAMLMAIYKGPPMELVWSKHTDSLGSKSPVVTESSSNNWFMGFCFHILSTLASASLSLLWETLKQYSARLSLMTWIHLVGTLQATTVTFVLEHKRAVWTIGFDINFLAAAYSGIVTSSIA